jgi:hypothetical protein
MSRNTYSYGTNNKLDTRTTENWNGTAWVNFSRGTYTIDPNNNIDSVISEKWTGTAWQNQYKTMHTYDLNNNRIINIQQQWNGSAWDNSTRGDYTYNANNDVLVSRSESWVLGAWQNGNEDSLIYDVNNNLVTGFARNWAGGAWVDYLKSTYTYDVNKTRTEVSQNWNGTTGTNQSKEILAYDANHNITSELFQLWDGQAWVKTNSFTNLFDGNNFQIYSEYKSWDANGTKITDGDSTYIYYHSGTNGIHNMITKGGSINIYPNPFSEQTTIYLAEEMNKGILEITDVLGKKIKSINFTGNRVQLEKAEMKPGVYYVRITEEHGMVTSGKIVVQ